MDRKKSGFDYHTVEDLHGMSAAEILSGPEEDSKMRHFTGMFGLCFRGKHSVFNATFGIVNFGYGVLNRIRKSELKFLIKSSASCCSWRTANDFRAERRGDPTCRSCEYLSK